MMSIWDLADARGNVRLADLAHEAGVDLRTARKWVDANLLPHRHLPLSRRVTLKAGDVEQFLASIEHKSA